VGIIGKLSFEPDQALAHPVLEQMLDAVRHRGADSRGIYTAPGIALGWRGNAAVDGGRTVHVVADGDAGCAQLILDAYLERGDRCVEALRAPCAFAVWDARTRRLLLARDHAGTRPLYFAVLHGHGVVFASGIRALLTDPGVGREWCPVALDAYLAHGQVPSPLTPYRRISKLEPAHRLVVEGRSFHNERYWDPTSFERLAPQDAGPALRLLWEEHCGGHRDHARRFWALLMLELWFREFIDGGVAEAPLGYALARAA
jgi:asparagine synthetase B (glutamine-hydrolysing)